MIDHQSNSSFVGPFFLSGSGLRVADAEKRERQNIEWVRTLFLEIEF